MEKISELEQQGLVEALGVKEEDLAESRYNLLGFFGVLYEIDQRLKNEEDLQQNEDIQRTTK
jgi:hypothetical protein